MEAGYTVVTSVSRSTFAIAYDETCAAVSRVWKVDRHHDNGHDVPG